MKKTESTRQEVEAKRKDEKSEINETIASEEDEVPEWSTRILHP